MADPDGDGSANLLEYAFNMDPVSPSVARLIPGSGTSGLPHIQMEDTGGSAHLTIEFVRRRASTNPQIEYLPEFSGDLKRDNWDSPASQTVTPINDEWERVQAADTVAVGAADARFGRVRIVLLETLEYE